MMRGIHVVYRNDTLYVWEIGKNYKRCLRTEPYEIGGGISDQRQTCPSGRLAHPFNLKGEIHDDTQKTQ